MIRTHEGERRALSLRLQQHEPCRFERDLEAQVLRPKFAALAELRCNHDWIAVQETHDRPLWLGTARARPPREFSSNSELPGETAAVARALGAQRPTPAPDTSELARSSYRSDF